MNDIGHVLGILGAYFAVLLVLAVAVEAILDPFKLFKGLRKKVSPEDYMKDVKEWLPANSKGKASASAIANFVEEYDAGVKDLEERVKEISAVAKETATALDADATGAQQKLAVYMAAIRSKYALDERKRITILRVVSAIIGVVLAFLLKIDTFDLLIDLFPTDAQTLLSSAEANFGGMLLTGLAASAGSSFWHDQLGKVRALKEGTRKIQEAVS